MTEQQAAELIRLVRYWLVGLYCELLAMILLLFFQLKG